MKSNIVTNPVRESLDKKIAENVSNIRRKHIELKKEEIEEQISTIVYVYGFRGGIYPNQIAEILGIDRSNILPYTKSLENKEKITRKNPQSPYLPTDQSYYNFLLEASLFGESSLRLLRKSKKNLILTNEESQTGSKFDTYKNYFKPTFTKNDDVERVLFEFSNRIGAFIIRSIIEATKVPKSNTELIIKSTDAQNAMTQAYMNKTISILIPYLIPLFKKFVRNIPELRNEFYEQTRQNGYSWNCPRCDLTVKDYDFDSINKIISIHEKETGHEVEQYIYNNQQIRLKEDERGNFLFSDKITLQLLNSFSNVYPLLGYEFNRIIEGMPNNKESYKEYTESLHKKWERQKNCDHKFGHPVESLHGLERICSKCEYHKGVKRKKTKLKSKKRSV